MFFEESDQPRTDGSFGWASGCHAGGREFDSGRTSGSYIHSERSATFVITLANG